MVVQANKDDPKFIKIRSKSNYDLFRSNNFWTEKIIIRLLAQWNATDFSDYSRAKLGNHSNYCQKIARFSPHHVDCKVFSHVWIHLAVLLPESLQIMRFHNFESLCCLYFTNKILKHVCSFIPLRGTSTRNNYSILCSTNVIKNCEMCKAVAGWTALLTGRCDTVSD